FDQRRWILIRPLGSAGFVLNEPQLIQLSRIRIARVEQPIKQVVEKLDQRRLASKIKVERKRLAAGVRYSRSHPAEHIYIRAAKAVHRLLPIADDEKVGAFTRLTQRELPQQVPLKTVCILKFVDQKKAISTSRAF